MSCRVSRRFSNEFIRRARLESEEDLRRFQAGELPENDQEWYKLVPASAREVLDKREVTRQSILFEIIKSERDYVNDLLLVKEVLLSLVSCCGST